MNRCSLGCDTVYRLARGLCPKHYRRLRRHGDVNTVLPPHRTTKDVIKYRAAHARVERARGRAADQECVDCGGPAQQWSYDHTDPDQLTEWDEFIQKEKPYSMNPDHYHPRCLSCHGRHDRKVGRS